MRRAAALILLLLAPLAPASAHALDEYLQAALIAVQKDRLDISMRLVPGVAVFPAVLASMDGNRDGVIAPQEAQAYARRVLGDMRITLDGKPLTPQLASVKVPEAAALKDGLGEIRIEISATLPPGSGKRKLAIENHHLNRISSYLVNSLASRDGDIQLLSQHRNADQSFYELEYAQAGKAMGGAAADTDGFGEMFRLGLRHIREGTDHLLFLLALLLPAPLLAGGRGWGTHATIRNSLWRIAGVVTAFTLGHSLTLALSSLGLVAVPSGPVEALIAVSILVSALHAMRPIFPGREVVIAACFGLVHGLAFATVLERLGLSKWQLAVNLLGFNLGIEAMQMTVVCAVLPSLLLLSRTPVYAPLRIGGALFAGLAASCWLLERILGLQTPVDRVVNTLAHWAPQMAVFLFLAGLACWSLRAGFKRSKA